MEVQRIILLAIYLYVITIPCIKSQDETPEAYLNRLTGLYEEAAAKRNSRLFFPFYFYYNPAMNNGTYTYVDYAPKEELPPQEETFDFIIVGSNSAGVVLANRLTEVAAWRVLLLEAGEDPNPIADIPYTAPTLQFTNYTWRYLAQKQDNAGLGLEDGIIASPRGRSLGGTSTINYMISTRGNKADYDRWAAQGNPGWGYKDVFPYFLKLEDSRLQVQTDKYHARGGPQTVENVPYVTESAHAFVKAAQEAGHKYRDYNGKSQAGVSYMQATLRNGRRCGSNKAYLQPARYSRSNLKVLVRAKVKKILIDPNTKVAYGVEYTRNRRNYTAKATKEVILSAGTYSTPQVLMLSGIGPKQHLEEMGIPIIKELPVGQRFYDHLAFFGLAFTVNSSIVTTPQQAESGTSFLEYLEYSRGPLTSTSLIEALAFIKTEASREGKSYPDVELLFVGGGFQTDRGVAFRKAFRISDAVYNAIFRPLEYRPAWSVFPVLMRPRSKGYLKLKSTNPFSWIKVFGNYLSDPEQQDVNTLVAAIREVQKIAKSPSLKKYNSTLVTTKIPGCEGYDFDSDPYWKCAVRHLSAPFDHDQIGSCKMGPSFDKEAVVDSKLQVHGLKNLRIVDSSVIPVPITGQVNIPTVMIGEKAADMIKEYWEIGVSPLPSVTV